MWKSLFFVFAFFEVVNCFQCTYDFEPDPFLSAVTCSCNKVNGSQREYDKEIKVALLSLEISDCKSIGLEFLAPTPGTIRLSITDEKKENFALELQSNTELRVERVDKLQLILPSGAFDLNATFVEVNEVQNVFRGDSEFIAWLGITQKQLFFYLVIALASTLLLCILVIIPIIIFCLNKRPCCDGQNENPAKESKRVSRAESWRYESSVYVNPRNRARMTTHQLPYQLVPQREQEQNHIANYLGRSTQFPMQIGLPSPSPDENEDNAFRQEADDSFDNASHFSSTSYDPSHNTSTLPANQKTIE